MCSTFVFCSSFNQMNILFPYIHNTYCRNLRIKGDIWWEIKLMGLRSSSLVKKNDDTLTWVLHRRDFCQQDSSQKPHETKSYRGSTSAEYRGRRHNNHIQRKRRNHVHSNILDYGKPDQTYGYGISDLDDFLSKVRKPKIILCYIILEYWHLSWVYYIVLMY